MIPEIEMKGIVKRFGGLTANNHIDFVVAPGEIRALVGENGAGKTTLMRILFGLYYPDAGTIKIRGVEVDFHSPRDAISQRIGMVHQHFMLFEDLTVAENIVYGMEPKKWGFVDRGAAKQQVLDLAERYGFDVEPDALLSDLSVGEKQRVEIIKTLYRGADVLILDEPTAVLTPQEREELFDVLRSLSEQGKTIILITHKLREVMELSHNATVLRLGKLIGNVVTAETSPEELACMMVGREVYLQIDKPEAQVGEPVLMVENVTLTNSNGLKVLDDISFEVHAGEVVGIAGVAGNGQTELIDTLIGFQLPDSGKVFLNETDISRVSVSERRELGFSYIPEDRYKRGLAISANILDNLAIGFHRKPWLSKNGILDAKALAAWGAERLDEYDVRISSPDEAAGNLSGGNLQKLILARELYHSSSFILTDQPTRGVDIGATEFIRKQLIARRNAGDGILLVSADLSEIMSLSDRILVMYTGRIMASVPAVDATEQQLGLLMAGVKPDAG
jgi:general nucleoside transport system ATP-binding protein